MSNGFVISDLHMFSSRSVVDEHLPLLHQQLQQADFLVLNGDIFDFKWSILQSTDATIDAAIAWLRSLARAYPHCKFQYVVGNHDALRPFVVELRRLAMRMPNFFVHLTQHKIGNTLFFHGDLHLRQQDPYLRPLQTEMRIQSKFADSLYSLIVQLSLHHVARALHFKQRSVRSIARVLKQYPNALMDDVEHIYFGHTHVPFSDYQHGDYTYHNTGSAVQGVRCDLLAVKSYRGTTS